MNQAEIKDIFAEVQYKDWRFYTGPMANGSYVQVGFPDRLASEGVWTGRKWYVSPFATKSEVVQTLLLAVLTAEEHEAREHFLYQGQAIFGPHLNVDELLDLKLEVRTGGQLRF